MPFSSQNRGGFASTHWSMVLSAGHKSSPESGQALASLCQRYWFPLYSYVRRRVVSAHEAQDLTQEFFARLLEKNTLAVADPDRGRFRTFLLTALSNFLANEWEKAKAQKRGGERVALAIDFDSGDSRYNLEPTHDWTPEKLFNRRWTMTLLDQVLVSLRREYEESGKHHWFESLKGFLSGGSLQSHAQIAAEMHVSEGAVKVAAHRLRKRYRELLREEVAQTVAEGEDVEDEIRELFRSLAE